MAMDITNTAVFRQLARRRLGAAALGSVLGGVLRPVVLVVLAAAVSACNSPTAATGPSPVVYGSLSSAADGSAPMAGLPPLEPTAPPPIATPSSRSLSATPNYTDPVEVAARYVRSTCTVDWHEQYGTRERRGAVFLTVRAARAAAPSAAGRADWDSEVVRRELIATCRITAAQVLDEAPNTATTRYVDVVAVRDIGARGHAVNRDQAEYTYVLLRVHGRWLVDGSATGG